MSELPDISTLVSQAQQVAATNAYALEERIVATIRDIRASWVALAQHLYEFDQESAWLALGYESLEQWLASPDIEISRTHYYSLKEAYREFVIERGVTTEQLGKVDFTKARETLPAIRRGHVEPADALADAEALTRTDLEEKYRHRAPLKGMDNSIQPDTFHFAKCPHCGARMKVQDD